MSSNSGPRIRPWLAVLLVGLAAAVVHVTARGHLRVLYVLSPIAGAVAAVIGIRARRESGHGWALLAAALWLWSTAEVVYFVADLMTQGPPAFPSPADPFYVAGYACAAGGVLVLTKGLSRGSLLDGVVLAVGVGAVVWARVLEPILLDGSGGPIAVGVAAFYPLADTALAVPLCRVLLTRSHVAATRLLAAALGMLLLGDLLYAQAAVASTYAPGAIADGAWMCAYALFGSAALHPSMGAIGRERADDSPLTVKRLIALFVVIAALVVSDATHLVDSDRIRLAALLLVLALVAVRVVTPLHQLNKAALRDPLTGLANRACVVESLRRDIESLRAVPGEIAVLSCGVEQVKLVNNCFGGRAADEFLVGVARRLRDVAPAEVLVGRSGDDEFVAVTPHAGCADLERLAVVLRSSLQRPIVTDGVPLVATLTVGFTKVSDPSACAEETIRAAETAQHDARRRGLPQARFTTTLTESVQERLVLAADLRRAAEARSLHTAYQPEVVLASGELFGFEALARWQHPVHGDLPPSRFIPVAEASGVVDCVFEVVLDQALAACRAWRTEFGFTPTMSVNLSPHQLVDARIVTTIESALRHHDLDASALCVEVTESVASEPMKVRTVLHALRAAGVRLAIDDFGTGWSSLARLAQLPWDLLKIDRGFISGLGSWGHAETVVGSAIELAHAMGIAALAEGVETVQQASIVRDLGCDYAQGFLYSRPLTRHAATAWVDATSGRHGDVVGARSA